MPDQSVNITLEDVLAKAKQDVEEIQAISSEAARVGIRPGPLPVPPGSHLGAPRWAGVAVFLNDPQTWLLGELPARWLARRGIFVDVIRAVDPLDQQRLLRSRRGLRWVFDSAAAVHLPLMTAIRATGGRVLINVDDLFWFPPRWIGPGPATLMLTTAREVLERRIREADGLLCQSSALAERLRERFPDQPVITIPQCLPPAAEWPIPRPRPPGGLRVGWAGTFGHHADLELLHAPVLTFLERVPTATLVIAGGCIPAWMLGHPRIELHPGGVYLPGFYRWLATLDLDLFVTPLVPDPWNQCKSLIKPLEAAMLGLPVIASKVPPYADGLRHGETAWLVENTDEAWLDALTELAGDAGLRARLAAGGRAWAATNTIEQTGPLWARLFGAGEEKP